MDRFRVGLVVLLVATLAPAHAAKKVKARATQVSHQFSNASGQPAYGLVVKLSGRSAVATDPDNNAGPFRNFKGNDTTTIVLSNPDEPIAAGASVEVAFRPQR